MDKGRMEAFSDGVIAIITIMALEMKAPHGTAWAALAPVLPPFINYIMSFAYLAICWNNHPSSVSGLRALCLCRRPMDYP